MSINYNYEGSVAERFVNVKSSSVMEIDNSEEIQNAISLYMPLTKCSANLKAGSFDPTTITSVGFGVVEITADNYKEIMLPAGNLYAQWKELFNEGTNFDAILYIVIFYDTPAVSVADKSITQASITKAFKALYMISNFKTMYDDAYSAHSSKYFDYALCLALLCENDDKFSIFVAYAKLTALENASATDSNDCKVQTQTSETELSNSSTFTDTDTESRAQYFWGFLKTFAPEHTWFFWNNGEYMPSYEFSRWFSQGKNSTGMYIGNSFCKYRLTGSNVKPTGLPSVLDSEVNMNLDSSICDILDKKNVGYFISISAQNSNDCELISDKTLSGMPVGALQIGRYIDYQTSQDIANWYVAKERLCNNKSYEEIQDILKANVGKFISLGKLTSVSYKFPEFSQVKKGNSIVGSGVWSAYYVDGMDKIEISDSIYFGG